VGAVGHVVDPAGMALQQEQLLVAQLAQEVPLPALALGVTLLQDLLRAVDVVGLKFEAGAGDLGVIERLLGPAALPLRGFLFRPCPAPLPRRPRGGRPGRRAAAAPPPAAPPPRSGNPS